MYFGYKSGGYPRQEALWDMVSSGLLTFHPITDSEAERMHALMARYKNVPMDVADASLVAAAETLRDGRILTLDSDFFVFRWNETEGFEVLP
jgi:predicted nucleic acid-binding protein